MSEKMDYQFYTMVDGKPAILIKLFDTQETAEKYANKLIREWLQVGIKREYCLYYHGKQVNFWN